MVSKVVKANKQDQTVTRQEFNNLNSKVDCLITHCKVFEKHYHRQQKGIEEILKLLHTTKGLGSLVKAGGILATSITAIIDFFQNLKGWLTK